MNNRFYQKPNFWQLGSVVLLLPAFFSHLGYLPLDTASDEPRRALVALEMILSGDYLTPTLNGQPYFNKPPLYNWLIALSFRLFGNYSSFALRFPMALSLVLYGLTIYGFVREQLGKRIAFAAALLFVTNGRILIYDSLLGLIDVTFSWLTYTAFMLVYRYDQRKKYALLFATTYALTALTFLMKGLPALVFQGLTLLTYFGYTRQFRKLFTPAHLAGIATFLVIVGGYYVAYFTRNAIPPEKLISVLFDESAKRTVVKFGIGQTLLHLLTFPFEMLYHYAPWMALVLLLIRRDVGTLLKTQPFIWFNGLIFLANFVVYWSSPQVYARYLFMFLPLLFTIFAYVYYEKTTATDWQRRWVEGLFGFAVVVVTLGSWVPFFLPQTQTIPGLWWKCGGLFLVLAFVAVQYIRQPPYRLVIMITFLAVFRIGFNWFVLPPRLANRQAYKDSSEEAARQSLGRPLYGYKQTIGQGGATDVNSFHIEVLRGDILRITDQKVPGALYIADSTDLAGEQYRTLYPFTLFDRHPARLVEFR